MANILDSNGITLPNGILTNIYDAFPKELTNATSALHPEGEIYRYCLFKGHLDFSDSGPGYKTTELISVKEAGSNYTLTFDSSSTLPEVGELFFWFDSFITNGTSRWSFSFTFPEGEYIFIELTAFSVQYPQLIQTSIGTDNESFYLMYDYKEGEVFKSGVQQFHSGSGAYWGNTTFAIQGIRIK